MFCVAVMILEAWDVELERAYFFMFQFCLEAVWWVCSDSWEGSVHSGGLVIRKSVIMPLTSILIPLYVCVVAKTPKFYWLSQEIST